MIQVESRSLKIIENKICTSCKEFLDEKRKDFADFLILRQRIQSGSLCDRYRKSIFFYSTRKTTNLVFGFIEIKIFVDILFMNEFMSAATRNISNLLRRICVTFPVCGFFFCCSHPNLSVVCTVNVQYTSGSILFILSNP